MASNPDFVQYIVDQCGGAGEVTAHKMFGDYTLYCNGTVFGLVCDNGFYLKPVDALHALLREVDMRPPYEGAKPYFYITDVDDRDYLAQLVSEVIRHLPAKKKQIKQ